ncbi:29862_t:CDS:2, partial [Gigaspora margarita]
MEITSQGCAKILRKEYLRIQIVDEEIAELTKKQFKKIKEVELEEKYNLVKQETENSKNLSTIEYSIQEVEEKNSCESEMECVEHQEQKETIQADTSMVYKETQEAIEKISYKSKMEIIDYQEQKKNLCASTKEENMELVTEVKLKKASSEGAKHRREVSKQKKKLGCPKSLLKGALVELKRSGLQVVNPEERIEP